MGRRSGGRGTERLLAFLLGLCLASTLGLGLAKLFVQRAHLPPYASPTHNTYHGFVSIDEHCLRAERIRDWLLGRDDGGARLRAYLSKPGQPTAVLVPGVVAVLSLPTGSILVAFVLASCCAFALSVLLVARLGGALAGHLPRTAALAAGILLAGHCNSARTAAQLLLDPFAEMFALAAVLLTIRWLRRPTPHGSLGLVAVQAGGVLVKLSYFPLLAAPALVALVAHGRTGLRRALLALLAFGIAPLFPFVIYLLAVPKPGSIPEVLETILGGASRTLPELRHLVLEMVLLFQLFPLVHLLRPHLADPAVRGVLAVALLFLLTILSMGLPDDPRLYLPVLGFLAAASTPSVLDLLPGRRLPIALAAYVALNHAMALAGLVAQAR